MDTGYVLVHFKNKLLKDTGLESFFKLVVIPRYVNLTPALVAFLLAIL